MYDSLRHNKPLPTQEYNGVVAVFGRFMDGVVVCCTGFPVEEREDLHQKVCFMGGSVLRDLTDAVTHLVATSTDTEKYKVQSAQLQSID